MRFVVLGLAAFMGLGVGTISAVAAAKHHTPAPSQYDIASTNVDLGQAKLASGDIASARAHLEVAKTSTAACDAELACKSRKDNFSLHARLDQLSRRVALWEKK